MRKKLVLSGAQIEYELERKRVKNINLRVKRSGEVYVSASRLVPVPVIEGFLRSKADFILRAQAERAAKAAAEQRDYGTGESVSIFGGEYPLCVIEGKRNRASFDGERVVLEARPGADNAERGRAVDRLLRELCIAELTGLCDRWQPVFDKSIPGQLELRFRNMKTRWGSCQPRRSVITFNTALARYPVRCAEYVVVHELTHFLHPDHSARFYASLAAVLPDWKERRGMLK